MIKYKYKNSKANQTNNNKLINRIKTSKLNRHNNLLNKKHCKILLNKNKPTTL